MTVDPRARRDAGLRRVGRLSRWVVAGGLGLTGVFSVVAARAFSGSTTSQTQTSSAAADSTTQDPTSATTPTTAASNSASSNSSSSSLQTPTTLPSRATGSSHVRSGGS